MMPVNTASSGHFQILLSTVSMHGGDYLNLTKLPYRTVTHELAIMA